MLPQPPGWAAQRGCRSGLAPGIFQGIYSARNKYAPGKPIIKVNRVDKAACQKVNATTRCILGDWIASRMGVRKAALNAAETDLKDA